MSCERHLENASDRLDDRLDAGERAAFDRHLAGCPACRATYAALAENRDALRALRPPSVPPTLLPRLERALAEEVRTAAREPGLVARLGPWRMAAGFAAAFFAVWALTRPEVETGADRGAPAATTAARDRGPASMSAPGVVEAELSREEEAKDGYARGAAYSRDEILRLARADARIGAPVDAPEVHGEDAARQDDHEETWSLDRDVPAPAEPPRDFAARHRVPAPAAAASVYVLEGEGAFEALIAAAGRDPVAEGSIPFLDDDGDDDAGLIVELDLDAEAARGLLARLEAEAFALRLVASRRAPDDRPGVFSLDGAAAGAEALGQEEVEADQALGGVETAQAGRIADARMRKGEPPVTGGEGGGGAEKKRAEENAEARTRPSPGEAARGGDGPAGAAGRAAGPGGAPPTPPAVARPSGERAAEPAPDAADAARGSQPAARVRLHFILPRERR